MKLFCLILGLLGICMVNGVRVPADCGMTDAYNLTASQNPTEDHWAMKYEGDMFEVNFNTSADMKRFTWSWKMKYLKEEVPFWCDQSGCGVTKEGYNEYEDDHYRVSNYYSERRSVLWRRNGSKFPDRELEVGFSPKEDGPFCTIKNIKLKDCRTEYPLLVTSSTSTYNSTGVFDCVDGFDLISSSEVDRTTICMNNGEWKNADIFKCYQAPKDVQVSGNLTVKENENVEICCNFTQTIPVAYQVKYSVGHLICDLLVDESYSTSVTSEDNGKEIWCQPQTEYTEIPQYSNRGKSEPRQLNVLFPPRLSNEVNEVCIWTIANSCNFTFLSNPMPDVVMLFKVNNSDTELNGTYSRPTPVPFNYSSTSQEDIHTITITDIEMNSLSSGSFVLSVISNVFPNNVVEHQFDVHVFEPEYDNPMEIPLLVCFIIEIIALLFYIIKRRYNPPSTINPTINVV